jgi:sugar phosphate isomerase/epimerase
MRCDGDVAARVSRRAALRGLAAGALMSPAALTRGAAIDPIPRSRPGRLKLSLAAYSVRQLLDFSDPKMDMFGFVDFAADLGFDAVEPTSYWFPPDADAAWLRGLRQYAFRQGLDVSGTAIRNDFCVPPAKLAEEVASVRRWIDRASELGAPVMRIFGGNVPQGADEAEVVEQVVGAIESLLPHAVERGVTMALENHGGITTTPEQLLRIVRAVDAPDGGFAVNLDGGNFHGEDPYADFAQLAPYALNVQLKTEVSARGKPKEEADLGRLIGILREVRYSGYVVLEYEAAEDPLTAIPRYAKQLRGLVGQG